MCHRFAKEFVLKSSPISSISKDNIPTRQILPPFIY